MMLTKFPHAFPQDKLDVDELLNLLSWADDHKHVMSRFGVHNLNSEFLTIEKDLYVKYSRQVSTLQSQWQRRIMESESSHITSTISDGSKISSWPEDLIGCVGLQLQLAFTRLQGNHMENICLLCVGLLDDFRASLLEKFNKESGRENMPVEKLCVFSNDCFRFAELLHQEKKDMSESLDVAVAERIGNKIGDVIMQFSSISTISLGGIMDIICEDIQSELRETIFRKGIYKDGKEAGMDGSGEGGELSLESTKRLLSDCAANLRSWLCDSSLVGIVMRNSLCKTIGMYLEMLLNARPQLGCEPEGGTLSQIKADAQTLATFFAEFDDLIPIQLMDRELSALREVLQLCDMDIGMIEEFWMSKLVKSFGRSSSRVVECVLAMRMESGSQVKGVMSNLRKNVEAYGEHLIHDEKSVFLLNLVSVFNLE